jgi:tetratricopeptide (TPR) repeat protein
MGRHYRRLVRGSSKIPLVAVAASLLLLPGVTRAAGRAKPGPKASGEASAAELLAEAKVHFDNDELTPAEDRLDQALEKKDELREPELVELYAYLAVVRLRLGNVDGAKDVFRALVKLRPNYHISRRIASMRIVQFFERFRERELRATRAVLKHEPPPRFAFGAPLDLSAEVEDHTGTVHEVKVYFREKGSTGSYSSTTLAADPDHPGHYVGVIPYLFGDHLEPFEVEYYLAAVTLAGDWVTTMGSARKPLTFEVEGGRAPVEEEASGITSRWWFWTGIGVLVAGGAAGGYFGYRATHPPPETGSATLHIE